MSDLLAPHNVAHLEKLAAEGSNAPIRRRAQLLLLYHEGKPTAEVARTVGLSAGSVLRWRRLFREQGMGVFPNGALQAAPQALPKAEAVHKPAPDAPGKAWQEAAAKLVEAAKGFVGDKKKAKKFKQIASAKPFQKFIAHLEAQRGRLKKQLKKKTASGKKARKLKKQLRALDGHLKKARKLLKKMP